MTRKRAHRHHVYENQYRAMFVLNCTVVEEEKLHYKAKKKRQRKQRELAEAAASQADEREWYHPVKCSSCQTEVGVYDIDEIYHFTNVIASH